MRIRTRTVGLLACVVVAAIPTGCGGTKKKVVTDTRTVTAPAAETTGEQTAAQPRPRPSASLPPLAAYSAPSYTAKLPETWNIEQDYAPQGGQRYVTKAVRPGGRLSVLIDTTLNTEGDPADSAATLEPGARSSRGYRRLVYGRTTLGGDAGFVWAYRQGGTTRAPRMAQHGCRA